MQANRKTLLLTLLLAVQVSACTVVPVSRPYYYPRESVYAAPPPRVEYLAPAYVAPAPVVGQVWIGTSPGWGPGYREPHRHRHEYRGWR